ncbi:MAG: hypothetical protein LBE18_02305 [Planctomycetaceae bacterium]|jgi:predicted Zn-ribbon and HTH transcriptional regulator|nr:hypothetical protein [Planctomycetaceae bacterium]
MFPFTLLKFSRIAIFLHDSYQWHAYVFYYHKTRWEVLSTTTCLGKNPRQIPSSLFLFAEQHNARRVRIVLSQSIQKLEKVELPIDATPEELQTVISLAYSQATGSEYGTFRVVSSFADSFEMGGESESFFAAGIDLAQLEQYDKNCHNSGLQFNGCGILELAAVTVGTKYFTESRFLIILGDKGFYVTCASDNIPMTTSGITFAKTIDDKNRDTERTQATARRINAQKMFPLQVWYTADNNPHKLDELRNSIDPETQVTFTNISQYLEDIAREIASSTELGSPGTGGAIVGLPEKEKDPYRAGTWLFAAIIVIAIIIILATYQTLRSNMNTIKSKNDAWEKLKNERKKLTDKLNALDTDRKRNEKIIQILSQKNPLPVSMITMLEELKQNMPVYTRLTSIEQIENEEIILTGYTYYQEGFFELHKLLNQKLLKYKMTTELKSMEKIADSKGQKFVLRLYHTN